MSQHYATLNDSRDRTIEHCIGIIERHAPVMMRVGGHGGFQCEQLNHGEPVRDDEKRQIIALGRAGIIGPTEIARRVGRSMTTVWRVLKTAHVQAADTRGRWGHLRGDAHKAHR